MKFAHLGDCHLGGWRQPELQQLNFQHFQLALNKCIQEKVEFILITGDLFDSAYPPIDTLKEAFREFKKIADAKIPVFLIAGSHDYSASGKTFLDVLSNSGFCINVARFEDHKGKIMLLPTVYKNCAIYGYPGKKSGLEVDEVNRCIIQDSPGMFKILMLHTAIRDAVGNLPIPAVEDKNLPPVDYLALSHLHAFYSKDNKIYSGPIFPNNLQELEELQSGSFCIYENGKIRREILKLKEVINLKVEIESTASATDKIISEISALDIRNKILILHLKGSISEGNISDIDFQKIEQLARKNGVFSFIKSTSDLNHKDSDIFIEYSDNSNIEQTITERFLEKNNSKFNSLVFSLLHTLNLERLEEEKNETFEQRLMLEINRVLKDEIK